MRYVDTIAVIIPVLGRPGNAAPVVESIREASRVPTDIWFVCTPRDDEQIEASAATGANVAVAPWDVGQGDYARKINLGLTLTAADWIFTGADDIRFAPGWDDRALHAARHGAGVIGTTDGCNPRTRNAQHSTHSLVARAYAVEHGTADRPGHIYHEGYWHNFVDDELVLTAKARRAYAPSRAHVQHLHPMRGTAVYDDTYQLGHSRFRDDRQTFRQRRPLWGHATRRAAR